MIKFIPHPCQFYYGGHINSRDAEYYGEWHLSLISKYDSTNPSVGFFSYMHVVEPA